MLFVRNDSLPVSFVSPFLFICFFERIVLSLDAVCRLLRLGCTICVWKGVCTWGRLMGFLFCYVSHNTEFWWSIYSPKAWKLLQSCCTLAHSWRLNCNLIGRPPAAYASSFLPKEMLTLTVLHADTGKKTEKIVLHVSVPQPLSVSMPAAWCRVWPPWTPSARAA